jgi:hypothetical protein
MDRTEARKTMPEREFAQLGVHGLAYVKPVVVDGRRMWAMHSADGQELGMSADRDAAFVALRQHELEPLSVH